MSPQARKPRSASDGANKGQPIGAPKGAPRAKLKCPDDVDGQHCVCFRKHGAACCWCKGVLLNAR